MPSLSSELETGSKNSGEVEAILAQITQNQRIRRPTWAPSPATSDTMGNPSYAPPRLATPLMHSGTQSPPPPPPETPSPDHAFSGGAVLWTPPSLP